MRPILRPCIVCGRPSRGSRCTAHAREFEAARQARQPYRAAYVSERYRTARRIRLELAGWRCERVLPSGERCPRRAEETHHRIPLSEASSLEEALALCGVANLEAVCSAHNPRGPVREEEDRDG